MDAVYNVRAWSGFSDSMCQNGGLVVDREGHRVDVQVGTKLVQKVESQ